jgi:ribosomal protein S18 acetylase RimI-like enzyme
MQDKITIREATIEDANIITDLGITTFVATFGPHNTQEDMYKYLREAMSLKQISRELIDKNNTFYLASFDSIPAGFAKLRATHTPPELKGSTAMEIERLYVLPGYQGKKIGAALMEQCIADANNLGYDTIWLGVWEHNPRAIDFYKRCGFEIFGSHDFLLGDDNQTDIMMKKALG